MVTRAEWSGSVKRNPSTRQHQIRTTTRPLHNSEFVGSVLFERFGVFTGDVRCGGYICLQRIHRPSIHMQLKMQVRAGAAPGVARQRNSLTPLNGLSFLDQNPVQMQVAGFVSVAVVDVDVLACERMVTYSLHNAIAGTENWGANGGGQINAVVRGDSLGYRVLAVQIEVGADPVRRLGGPAAKCGRSEERRVGQECRSRGAPAERR